MKTTWVILLAIDWAALSGGTVYAALSGQTPREASSAISAKPNADATPEESIAKPSADRSARGVQQISRAQAKSTDSIRHHALSRGSRVEAVRPAQRLSVERRATLDNGQGPQQFRQLQSANVKKGIPMQVAPSGAVPAKRSFRTIRLSTQLLVTVPHRGVNPPVISGAATIHRMESAAINGAQVHHNP